MASAVPEMALLMMLMMMLSTGGDADAKVDGVLAKPVYRILVADG